MGRKLLVICSISFVIALTFLSRNIWKANAAFRQQEPSPTESVTRHYDSPDLINNVPFHRNATQQNEQIQPLMADVAVPMSKIVFQSFRDGNWEIYLADENGANHTRLTADGSPDIYPRLNHGCT